jgi:uncharacterized protein YdeI (YjbR/CyaY-like superfamily)
MNPKIDRYLAEGCGRCALGNTPQCKVNFWQDELKALRRIALESGLTEESKWGMPCYTFDKKNIVIVSAFKEYAAMLFFKGALLKDPKGILTTPTENSQSGRQARYTKLSDIKKTESVLKAYLAEAIELEKSGAKVEFKKVSEFVVPEEFQAVLDKTPAVKKAFEALTPGRQKGYLLHFAGAKQSKTREARIEKCLPGILAGKGIDDR